MSNGPDVLEWEWLEFVLFEEIVQILLQHLKNQTRVVFVSEALIGSDKVEFVCIFLAETEESIIRGAGWAALRKVLQIPSCDSACLLSGGATYVETHS